MIKIWTLYTPRYPKTLLYMLQSSEYRVKDYFAWFHRTRDFRRVMKRRQLESTNKIKLLAVAEMVLVVTVIISSWYLAQIWIPLWLLPVILLPWVLAYGLIIPLALGDSLIRRPRIKKMKTEARNKLASHKATKIAIAGSFGKTTAKEVLMTVLSEKFNVAATPGNMNTPIGISRFVQTLNGNEDILLFEFGETHVGDVKELAEMVHPDLGVITGINEAHLMTFGSIENTIKTVFELQDVLGDEKVYKNKESRYVRDAIDADDPLAYGLHGVEGWAVGNSISTITGTTFTLDRHDKTIQAQTKLLGLHNIGVIALAVTIADKFGMAVQEIESGIQKTKPFEHRMHPYELSGAWVIDDTYNGNIEGVEAGLTLLGSFEAKRKIYVTPGLVEQGDKTQVIHERIGRKAAEVADVIILMSNSVTKHIQTGISQAGYTGELEIIEDPLGFYTNLEHFVAAGDIVLMQNDWTDNYE